MDDGVIAVHTSNRYLDLVPVVLKVAQHYNLENVVVRSKKSQELAIAWADWILLTRNERFLRKDAFRERDEEEEEITRFTAVDDSVPLWTDQYNNLFQILR